MKKAVTVILLLVVLGLSWYLFVKQGEYGVNFTARTVPGDVIQVAKIWNRSLEKAVITEVDSVEYLRQKISMDGREYLYEWHLRMVNDSTTNVNISISEKGNSFRNKFLVPFSKPPIEVVARELSYEFYEALAAHLKITKVRVEGVSEISENFCICAALQSDQLDKAQGMMNTYNFLVSFIEENNLKVSGKPLVDIKDWNHEQSKLKYDFCFPVAKSESLPASDHFFFKTIERKRALKAIYNGNYITSDRAWYYLIKYARENGLKIEGLPMEVFFNNPNMGLNEANWKAEIFLPVS